MKKSLHLDRVTIETDVLLLESQKHIKKQTHLNQRTNHSPIKKLQWFPIRLNKIQLFNMVYLPM